MHKRALLLDWGGTLMRTMPRWMGPGQGWTVEEPVPHVADVLQQLAASWRLCLATNAGESDDDAMRACLDTAGIGHLFCGFYTWGKAQAPKPWAPFWQYALRDLELAPEQVVMVGDDWMADVWGARQVGMYGVWFAPGAREPREEPGVRTMRDFRELPAILRDMGFDS